MTRTLLARTWFMVTILGIVGMGVGVLAAYMLSGHQHRYRAEATLAMQPAQDLPVESLSSFWEVLNRGQATRSAALVLEDGKWLTTAASAAGVPTPDLDLAAGAIPDTTLITVTMKANSGQAAEVALNSVLNRALDQAAKVSGPFRLDIVSSPDGSARSLSPDAVQMYGTLGIAGLVVGVGAGMLVSRSLRSRSVHPPHTAMKRKHALDLVPEALGDPQAVRTLETTSDKLAR